MPFTEREIVASFEDAIAKAVNEANENNEPCGIWRRGHEYAVSVIAPDLINPEPESHGWTFWALVDPDDKEKNDDDER